MYLLYWIFLRNCFKSVLHEITHVLLPVSMCYSPGWLDHIPLNLSSHRFALFFLPETECLIPKCTSFLLFQYYFVQTETYRHWNRQMFYKEIKKLKNRTHTRQILFGKTWSSTHSGQVIKQNTILCYYYLWTLLGTLSRMCVGQGLD